MRGSRSCTARAISRVRRVLGDSCEWAGVTGTFGSRVGRIGQTRSAQSGVDPTNRWGGICAVSNRWDVDEPDGVNVRTVVSRHPGVEVSRSSFDGGTREGLCTGSRTGGERKCRANEGE